MNTDASAWETTAATVPAKLRKAITNAAAALRDNWGFDTQVLLQGVRDDRPDHLDTDIRKLYEEAALAAAWTTCFTRHEQTHGRCLVGRAGPQ